MVQKALAGDMHMMLHNSQSTFYMQASTDFVVVVHPIQSDVILERILESSSSKTARNLHHQASVPAVHAGYAVPTSGASIPGASNVYDVAEKHDIRFGRGQWGLEAWPAMSPPPLSSGASGPHPPPFSGLAPGRNVTGWALITGVFLPQVKCCRVPQGALNADSTLPPTEVQQKTITSHAQKHKPNKLKQGAAAHPRIRAVSML